jgi:hypothetical protein
MPSCPHEALRHRGFRLQQSLGNLSRAHSAHLPHHKRNLRLGGNRWMATQEEHGDVSVAKQPGLHFGRFVRVPQAVITVVQPLPAKPVHNDAFRYGRKPTPRIWGSAFLRPKLDRPDECLLHRVLDEIDVRWAERSHE